MKKVKIMLMSALVVAAVGGALAFKANTRSLGLFCGDSPTSCPTEQNEIKYSITTGSHIADVYCTTPQGDKSDCRFVTLEN